MDRPRTVNQGTVGIFAPSGPFINERFEAGVQILKDLGLTPKIHPQSYSRQGYLAGPDEARLAAFHELLEDPGVDAIWAARGGYGLHRIIEGLDHRLVARAKKCVLGFSDVCALHSSIQRHSALMSLHAPVITQLTDLPPEDHQRCLELLSGGWSGTRYAAAGPVIAPGRATGHLMGGCLSVLSPLVGTPHFYLPKDAILLLEDVGEAPYRIDRLLTHLRLAGVFRSVSGVVLGDFFGCEPPRGEGPTALEVLTERLGDLGVPVLAGLPVGHGKRNQAMPLGCRVQLDTDSSSLEIIE